MKKYCFYITAVSVLSLKVSVAQSQEITKENEPENKLHQRISLIIAHEYTGTVNEQNDNKQLFIAASPGFNYELWFNGKWAIGLHNDIALQSFHAEKKGEEAVVEREFPVLTSVVAIYKPAKHWSFFAGPSREFEPHKNFNVIKTGIEYGIDISKTRELGIGADYDVKLNTNNSLLPGIGISKKIF